jgi:diacylglycerol kinase (ATP)
MGGFQKVLFIINPLSGRRKFPDLEKQIAHACKQTSLEWTIASTERSGHATELAKQAVNNQIDLVFAVGGDGTVNEVAKGLVHSSTTLGILPKGSGNGLARHLHIPQDHKEALALIQSGDNISIDAVTVNGEISVNVSGIGFDGHVSNLFAKESVRGLGRYVTLSVTEFLSFKNFKATMILDEKPFSSDAFILAFANSSQFGNNATVSPTASVCDGLMDICVIKKFPWFESIGFAVKMFTGKLHTSSYVKIFKAKKATLSFDANMPYHIDGEGRGSQRDFSVEVIPGCLKVLVPIRVGGKSIL